MTDTPLMIDAYDVSITNIIFFRMINPIDRASIKSELFSLNVDYIIAKDTHPFRPEIKNRRIPKNKMVKQSFPHELHHTRFLF